MFVSRFDYSQLPVEHQAFGASGALRGACAVGFFGTVGLARGFSACGLKADRPLVGRGRGFAEVRPVLGPAKKGAGMALGRAAAAARRKPLSAEPADETLLAFPARGSRYAASSKGGFTSERIRPGRFSSAAPSASAIITHTASPIRALIFAWPRMK